MHSINDHDRTPPSEALSAPEPITEGAARRPYVRPTLETYASIEVLTGDVEIDFGTS